MSWPHSINSHSCPRVNVICVSQVYGRNRRSFALSYLLPSDQVAQRCPSSKRHRPLVHQSIRSPSSVEAPDRLVYVILPVLCMYTSMRMTAQASALTIYIMGLKNANYNPVSFLNFCQAREPIPSPFEEEDGGVSVNVPVPFEFDEDAVPPLDSRSFIVSGFCSDASLTLPLGFDLGTRPSTSSA